MKLSQYLALVLLLLLGTSARADFIPWSSTWGTNTMGLAFGNSTTRTGFVELYSFSNTYSGTGSQENVPAVRVHVTGSATATPPYSTFPYPSLYMNLHDGPSNASTTLTFKGEVSGTIYNLNTTFTNPIQTVTLGKDTYTVMINPFISPMATDPRSLITANVFVRGPGSPPASNVPEPTSVVLIGLGLSTLGVRCWWRKVRPVCP
jgi:hypothetical protein